MRITSVVQCLLSLFLRRRYHVSYTLLFEDASESQRLRARCANKPILRAHGVAAQPPHSYQLLDSLTSPLSVHTSSLYHNHTHTHHIYYLSPRNDSRTSEIVHVSQSVDVLNVLFRAYRYAVSCIYSAAPRCHRPPISRP